VWPSLLGFWARLFDGIQVDGVYLLSPSWSTSPVLFSETVSEGCEADFCCACCG